MKRASDILAKLLDENSRAKAQSYSSVFGGWRDLAGLSLADHSRVYEIRHDNLFVEVDHNGWMQILQLRKPRILNRLRTRYPELGIRDLKVRVNPSMGPRPAETGESARETGPAEPIPAVPAVSPPGGGGDTDGEVDRVVSGVSQETLKRQLRKLFLSSLDYRRGRSDGGSGPRGPGTDTGAEQG
jgi:hypothetical protein